MLKSQAGARFKALEKEEQKEISRRQSYIEESLPLSNRITERSLRTSSCMSDRQKSNHCSTPKTKMNIKFEELIPNQMEFKRRVFL